MWHTRVLKKTKTAASLNVNNNQNSFGSVRTVGPLNQTTRNKTLQDSSQLETDLYDPNNQYIKSSKKKKKPQELFQCSTAGIVGNYNEGKGNEFSKCNMCLTAINS